MRRSVYSLVLMDEVVEGIDKLAYAQNTSRSNLVNQILADHISYVTPEKRMRDIFELVEKFMNGGDCFQVQDQTSDAVMSVRSSLRYKYRPSIRYGIELYRKADNMVGEMKAAFRTQSRDLIFAYNHFLNLWVALEKKYIGDFFAEGKIPCKIEDGRFTREFILPRDKKQQTNELIAKAIAEYIQRFDNILKIFFDNLDDVELAIDEMEREYLSYLREGIIVI